METLKTAKTPSKKATYGPQSYDMIVFCHLRWQFVYQRPQHIISRMAKDLKVLMIEEPVAYSPEEENTANLLTVTENLDVLQPKVKSITDIEKILPRYITDKNVAIGWFYSSAFVALLKDFNFGRVVYDCMDELSLFKGAAQTLIDQEKFLIANADIVFTGGKSLYESKSKLHPNVYCFPSSVDEDHFASALDDIALPEDLASIKGPIAGYCGVIDERIDLELLGQTAQKMPDVSFVMVGPLAKISEEELPRARNIHYLGMKSYEQLPAYLKGFEIAMMPFALNDATKYISPTKTLEYFAAGKPVISTRITDVVRDYSHCVTFADNAEEFCLGIQQLLAHKRDLSAICSYREILDRTSWDATVDAMKKAIQISVR